MLFQEGDSPLFRFSDAIKYGLRRCTDLTVELLRLLTPRYKQALQQAQATAKRAKQGEISYEDADRQLQQSLSVIPGDVVHLVVLFTIACRVRQHGFFVAKSIVAGLRDVCYHGLPVVPGNARACHG